MIEIQEEELKKIMSVLGEIPSKYSLKLILVLQQKQQQSKDQANESN
jgi:hypothetical protein